jgi:DNA modification methylase
MKPYYEHGGITIYHGDCRDILPLLSADVVLTDPPFGIGLEYGAFEDTPENVRALISDVVPMMRRAAPAVFITPGINMMWAYPQPDWVLAYFNKAGEKLSSWGFTTWVPVLAYGKDPYLARGLGARPDSFGVGRPATYRPPKHPCPKAPDVWQRLVQRACPEGCSVLDPFMGSGTTLVAAKQLGRQAIGIEIEERYCEIAANRLAQDVLDFAEVAP